ncbi:MAG: hypothetical protein R6V76_06770 [Desulfobacterales bacterium]
MKLLVNEIRVDKKEVRLSGSYSAMAGALHISTKHEHLKRVPSFDPVWLPGMNEAGHWEWIVII